MGGGDLPPLCDGAAAAGREEEAGLLPPRPLEGRCWLLPGPGAGWGARAAEPEPGRAGSERCHCCWAGTLAAHMPPCGCSTLTLTPATLLVLVQEGSLECYLVDCGVPPEDVDRVVTQVGAAQQLAWHGMAWLLLCCRLACTQPAKPAGQAVCCCCCSAVRSAAFAAPRHKPTHNPLRHSGPCCCYACCACRRWRGASPPAAAR